MDNRTAIQQVKHVRSLLETQIERIKAVLPQHMTPERMLRIGQSAMSKNPKLLECTDVSIVASVIMASELGLEPNTPLQHCFIIPYRTWNPTLRAKVMEATLQIGYQGLAELYRRSGTNRSVFAEILYENDTWSEEFAPEIKLTFSRAKGEPGAMIGYVAVLYEDGRAVYWCKRTPAQIREHAERFSPSYYKFDRDNDRREIDPKGLYHSHPDAYGLKTVLKMACKYAPKSIEDVRLMTAINLDDANGRVALAPDGAIDVNFAAAEAPAEAATSLDTLADSLAAAQEPAGDAQAADPGPDHPEAETEPPAPAEDAPWEEEEPPAPPAPAPPVNPTHAEAERSEWLAAVQHEMERLDLTPAARAQAMRDAGMTSTRLEKATQAQLSGMLDALRAR